MVGNEDSIFQKNINRLQYEKRKDGIIPDRSRQNHLAEAASILAFAVKEHKDLHEAYPAIKDRIDLTFIAKQKEDSQNEASRRLYNAFFLRTESNGNGEDPYSNMQDDLQNEISSDIVKEFEDIPRSSYVIDMLPKAMLEVAGSLKEKVPISWDPRQVQKFRCVLYDMEACLNHEEASSSGGSVDA